MAGQIAACRICVEQPLGTPLAHPPRPVVQLSPTARVCIAGQAPGMRVHRTGIPFNDPSGDRLREWMGIGRKEFYDANRLAIVPIGFCFPGYDTKGGDLPPRRECAKRWRGQVFDAMPQLELILVIGQYAQAWHLKHGRKENLTETVRNWRDTLGGGCGPSLLAMPHPSWRNNGWLRRNPWFEAEVLPELRKRVAALMLE